MITGFRFKLFDAVQGWTSLPVNAGRTSSLKSFVEYVSAGLNFNVKYLVHHEIDLGQVEQMHTELATCQHATGLKFAHVYMIAYSTLDINQEFLFISCTCGCVLGSGFPLQRSFTPTPCVRYVYRTQ